MADKDNTPSGSITCPKCMHLNSSGMKKCSRCGVVMLEYDGEDRAFLASIYNDIRGLPSFLVGFYQYSHRTV